jgi:hypothetical protein
VWKWQNKEKRLLHLKTVKNVYCMLLNKPFKKRRKWTELAQGHVQWLLLVLTISDVQIKVIVHGLAKKEQI